MGILRMGILGMGILGMGILGMGILGMDILGMGILVGIGHIGWEMGKLDGEKWGYWMGGYTERLGGLGLGRIRKLVCDGREILFLAFLERFQCWNSCTANYWSCDLASYV
jgi:hypothetical protein